jgi:hypothetical protein
MPAHEADHDAWLADMLAVAESFYDPDERLLVHEPKNLRYLPQLHDCTRLHPTRESLMYAVALLDGGQADQLKRAQAILLRVLDLQQTDPLARMFGVWPWYLEELLAGLEPGDFNWADFCAKQLLYAVIRHEHRLPKSLTDLICTAVYRACTAIIQRDVGPHYTNICVMGALVTLLAGEHYQHQPFTDYGLARLERFVRHTERHRTFEEYNSPDYTTVVITDLTGLVSMVRHAQARAWGSQMLDLAWQTTARHFHAPTRQWGGPHARSYSTLIAPWIAPLIEIGTSLNMHDPADGPMYYLSDWYGCRVACPDAWLPLFKQANERSFTAICHSDPEHGIEIRASYYASANCCLGTFNKEIMFAQRRNLLAYFKNGSETTSLHLRFLHDDFDFSSAVLACAQDQMNVLCGINLAVDGGDTHVNLDRINGTITAGDLRLSLELGGRLADVTVCQTADDACELSMGCESLQFCLLSSAMSGFTPKWEIRRLEDRLCLDWVIWSGPVRTIDLSQMAEAYLVFLIAHLPDDPGQRSAGPGWQDRYSARIEIKPDWVDASCRQGNTCLNLTLSRRPLALANLLQSLRADITKEDR